MNNFFSVIGSVGVGIIIIAIASILSGTIIWLTWDVVEIFFSPLVFLPQNPTWWQFVKVAWLVSTVARLFLPNVEIKK